MAANLDRLAMILEDAKHRLHSSKLALTKAESTIAEGERMEADILVNIEVLKDAQIIAIAEYQAALKELAHVRQGLIRLRTFQLDRAKDVTTLEKALEKASGEYQTAQLEDTHKVLPFRRKDG